jgi:hypothetical protein
MRIRICAHTGCGRFKTVLCAGAALLVGILATASNAQTYPARPVRMIVPFTPGGSTDIYARTLSPKLGDALGNKSSSIIVPAPAARWARISPPNLHPMATHSGSDRPQTWLSAPRFARRVPTTPCAISHDHDGAAGSSVLIVNAGSPLRSLKDLIAYAKKTPGGATYGSAGIGTTGHINGFLVAKVAGIELLHVPYKGASPAMLDLQAGPDHDDGDLDRLVGRHDQAGQDSRACNDGR